LFVDRESRFHVKRIELLYLTIVELLFICDMRF